MKVYQTVQWEISMEQTFIYKTFTDHKCLNYIHTAYIEVWKLVLWEYPHSAPYEIFLSSPWFSKPVRFYWSLCMCCILSICWWTLVGNTGSCYACTINISTHLFLLSFKFINEQFQQDRDIGIIVGTINCLYITCNCCDFQVIYDFFFFLKKFL